MSGLNIFILLNYFFQNEFSRLKTLKLLLVPKSFLIGSIDFNDTLLYNFYDYNTTLKNYSDKLENRVTKKKKNYFSKLKLLLLLQFNLKWKIYTMHR